MYRLSNLAAFVRINVFPGKEVWGGASARVLGSGTHGHATLVVAG